MTAATAFAAGSMAVGQAQAAQPIVTILNGFGPPHKSRGIVGDFYIDDRSHAIYGPKRSSGWGTATSLIGPRGATGSNGAGQQGAPGPGGRPGERGPEGGSGPEGKPGASGPEGKPGANGPEGKLGASGPEGKPGASGPEGKLGPQGLAGTVGERGPRGYSVLHGRVPPEASLGEENDFYIDTATAQLYGPKAGGVWGSPLTLAGSEVEIIDGGQP